MFKVKSCSVDLSSHLADQPLRANLANYRCVAADRAGGSAWFCLRGSFIPSAACPAHCFHFIWCMLIFVFCLSPRRFHSSIIFLCSFFHFPLIPRPPPHTHLHSSSFPSRLHPVYCVTSPAKDERYRAPPPTPPGYQGLALGDLGLADAVVSGPGGLGPRPPHLRPPDYSVALQRSKLLQSPGAAGGLAEARRLATNRLLQHQEDRSSGSTQGHSRPASICLPAQDLADSDDGAPPFISPEISTRSVPQTGLISSSPVLQMSRCRRCRRERDRRAS